MRSQSKFTIFLVIAFIIMLGAFYQLLSYVKGESSNLFYLVKINDAQINAEVASTPGLAAKGLMFREGLPQDQGMLFIFDKVKNHSFWMANTKMPLDIIWIASNYHIVHIKKGVQPCPYTGISIGKCPLYRTPIPSLLVLEVNSGWTDKNNVKVGDYMEVYPPQY